MGSVGLCRYCSGHPIREKITIHLSLRREKSAPRNLWLCWKGKKSLEHKPTLVICPLCQGETVFCRVEFIDGQTHLGRYCTKCEKRMPGLISQRGFTGKLTDLIGVPALKENRMKFAVLVEKDVEETLFLSL